MFRMLGIGRLFQWFVLACIVLAIWRAYNGNLNALALNLWSWIEDGSTVVATLWHSFVHSGATSSVTGPATSSSTVS